MSRRSLRQVARVSYYEPEEPSLDEYVFCDECSDYVFEYCAIHGALLVIPDDKVPTKPNFPSYVPRAALTIPKVFIHIARSNIPDAGLGVFSTLPLPRGVRFGPYTGRRTHQVDSMYCWQIYDKDNKPSHVVDAGDPDRSNWMRYVNCSRHWREQNLLAYQYRGQLYYRTIKIIPRFTELLVFYGSEFANILGVNLGKYNSPTGYAQKFGAPVPKKPWLEKQNQKITSKVSDEHQNITETAANSIPTEIKEHNLKCHKNSLRDNEVNSSTITNNITEEDVKQPSGNNKNYLIDLDKQSESCKITNKCLINNSQCDLNEKPVIGNSKSRNRTNTGEKPYKCDECQKCFTKISNLKQHIRTHTGEKPYKCDECQKCFTKNCDLKTHIRTHTGEKPYKCDECQKCFTQIGHLKIHIRTHTGEKPYKCDECQKCFTKICNLKKHIRIHTGEKPYKCDECQKCFTEIGHLKIHIRTHTGEKPYKCDECQKCFTKICNLKKHIRIHTGEKPYKCDECQKCFTEIGNLKKHIRTHTGEKPYKCDICDKRFISSQNLKYHFNTHYA